MEEDFEHMNEAIHYIEKELDSYHADDFEREVFVELSISDGEITEKICDKISIACDRHIVSEMEAKSNEKSMSGRNVLCIDGDCFRLPYDSVDQNELTKFYDRLLSQRSQEVILSLYCNSLLQ